MGCVSSKDNVASDSNEKDQKLFNFELKGEWEPESKEEWDKVMVMIKATFGNPQAKITDESAPIFRKMQEAEGSPAMDVTWSEE